MNKILPIKGRLAISLPVWARYAVKPNIGLKGDSPRAKSDGTSDAVDTNDESLQWSVYLSRLKRTEYT